MNTTNHCSTCDHDFPHAAQFCPYCGVDASATSAAAPFNRTLVGDLLREPSPSDTMMFDPIEDFRPGRGYGVKLLVGIAIIGAVVAGIFAGSWLADVVHRGEERVASAIEAPASSPAEAPRRVMPAIQVTTNGEGGFDITRGAEILHTVTTSNGSRYSNLDERMRSIAVRFNHISTRADGRFAARLVGDHYELVWADENGDFRLLDVTPEDVGDSGANPDFVTNLVADRLNAELPSATSPNNS